MKQAHIQKQKIVDGLREKFAESKLLIVTDYKGLNVLMINNLRRRLKEADIEYKVIKNTLLSRASEGSSVSLIKNYFKDTTAMVFSYKDPVVAAKIITKFAAENDKLKIKIAIMNDKVLDLASIKILSDLPSREVLLAQMLSVMNAVPTSFVRALSDLPRKMLNVLTAIKDDKEKKDNNKDNKENEEKQN